MGPDLLWAISAQALQSFIQNPCFRSSPERTQFNTVELRTPHK